MYNKELLKDLKNQLAIKPTYIQDMLASNKLIRLEAKLAYGAILNVLVSKALFDKNGLAYLKKDNPLIIEELSKIANKEVTKDKMNKYFDELEQANYLETNKMNLYVKELDV